jgi:hypothetical protein
MPRYCEKPHGDELFIFNDQEAKQSSAQANSKQSNSFLLAGNVSYVKADMSGIGGRWH